jgi:anthranilate synthase component 2
MFDAGRYHSWLVSLNDLPDSLRITSFDEEGRIMSLSHKNYDIHGVQFHPESIMTPVGKQILVNFLNHALKRWKDEGAAE